MLLALDTATTTASLAIYDLGTDQLHAEWSWQARRRQSQELLVAAQTLLAQIQRTPQDLTVLAVTTGPGSFTGVRIAISTAKGIGIGLPTPPRVIGVPTLTVTAAPWLQAASSAGATVYAYIQAGRGRYNWCVFAPNDEQFGLLRRPGADEHGSGHVQDFAAAISDSLPLSAPIWLTGESTPELRAALAPLANVSLLDDVSGLRRAGQLARVAALHLARGDSDDLKTLQPLYLRKAG